MQAEVNIAKLPCAHGRLQRDQAAHAHASNRQSGDELVSAQAQLAEQQARLTREADRRRNAEALLQEGLQVQNQILLGLQVLPTLSALPIVCVLVYSLKCLFVYLLVCVLVFRPGKPTGAIMLRPCCRRVFKVQNQILLGLQVGTILACPSHVDLVCMLDCVLCTSIW